MSNGGKAVLLVTGGLDPADGDDIIAAKLAEPGYRRARRFRADGDATKYLIIYELDDIAAEQERWEEIAASETSATGEAVLVITIEIDPADDEEFNRWYDEEHFAERLAKQGFLSGRRYRLHGDSSKHLVLYQLDEAASATRPGYMIEEPSARSKDMMSRWKDWSRTVWTEV